MADPYVRKDAGEITTISRPDAVSGTTKGYFSKDEFNAIKKQLGELEKKAPATLNAVMEGRTLSKADLAALKEAGISADEAALKDARAIRNAVKALGPNGNPEVFIQGAQGRPVFPENLQKVSQKLKEVMKTLTPDQTRELKEMLSNGEQVIKDAKLGKILQQSGLSESGYLLGQNMQELGPTLVKSLQTEFNTAARVGTQDAYLGLTAGKSAMRGSASVSEMLGIAGIAVTVYFTAKDVAEKAALSQQALADGRLSPQAYQEYKLNMTGQALSGFDPSGGMLAGAATRGSFEDFADKYHLDKKTRDELAPASPFFPSKSEDELKARYFFDRLPLHEAPGMPPAIREMVHMKQQIYQEAFDQAGQQLKTGLMPDIRERIQQQVSQDQGRAHMTLLQTDFMQHYNAELQKGTIDAFMKDPKNTMDAAYETGVPRIKIDTARAASPVRKS